MKIYSITSKVWAAENPWDSLDNPVSTDLTSWEGVLRKVYQILNFAIPFAGAVAVVMIIVGGYSLITSAGDPEKVEKGSKIITTAVVGMIIVFLTELIVKFIIDKVIVPA